MIINKKIIAVFGISVTAGSIFFAYTQVKGFLEKKLLGLWVEEAKKKNKELDEPKLKKELEKLYAWDLKFLLTYTHKVVGGKDSAEIKKGMEKITSRKITETADLKSLEGIILPG